MLTGIVMTVTGRQWIVSLKSDAHELGKKSGISAVGTGKPDDRLIFG